MTAVGRALKVFGQFWWDFLIGETPELFVGTLCVVGAAYLLHAHRIAAAIALPMIAAAFVLASVWRGRLRR